MDARDKEFAEKVIERLCKGGQVEGVRFGPILQILIREGDSAPSIKAQVYLNLGSAWMISDGPPEVVPKIEGDFPAMSVEEELAAICGVREQVIVSANLAPEVPHLFLALDSGKVLCLNGHDEQYEPWQLGVAGGDPNAVWLVVACPGDELAVWAPEGFAPGDGV